MTSFDWLERNSRIRFGYYLRPSYAISRAQCEMHDILRRQFGIEVGGKFMPHATITGFYRTDASLADQRAIWDAVSGRHAPFIVTNGGPHPHGRSGIGLDVHHDERGEPNAAMQALHADAYESILPLVHPECEFTFGNWAGDAFRAHLTLAMADIPEPMFDEVREFVCEAGEIGPRSFRAEWMHWYAFESDDWSGAWWATMRWWDLASWRLVGE